jgi:hypothetical protein
MHLADRDVSEFYVLSRSRHICRLVGYAWVLSDTVAILLAFNGSMSPSLSSLSTLYLLAIRYGWNELSVHIEGSKEHRTQHTWPQE